MGFRLRKGVKAKPRKRSSSKPMPSSTTSKKRPPGAGGRQHQTPEHGLQSDGGDRGILPRGADADRTKGGRVHEASSAHRPAGGRRRLIDHAAPTGGMFLASAFSRPLSRDRSAPAARRPESSSAARRPRFRDGPRGRLGERKGSVKRWSPTSSTAYAARWATSRTRSSASGSTLVRLSSSTSTPRRRVPA